MEEYVSSAPSSSSKNTPSFLFFFVGGNPCGLPFYTPLFENLERNLDVRIYAAGNLGQHLPEDGEVDDGSRHGLEAQIRHHHDFVRRHLGLNSREWSASMREAKPDAPHVVLAGHSIGAYICLHMLERDAALASRTASLLFLMPFITWKPLPLMHRARLTIFKTLSPLSRVAAVETVGLLESGLSPEARKRVMKLMSPGLGGALLDQVFHALPLYYSS